MRAMMLSGTISPSWLTQPTSLRIQAFFCQTPPKNFLRLSRSTSHFLPLPLPLFLFLLFFFLSCTCAAAAHFKWACSILSPMSVLMVHTADIMLGSRHRPVGAGGIGPALSWAATASEKL